MKNKKIYSVSFLFLALQYSCLSLGVDAVKIKPNALRILGRAVRR